MKHLAIMKKDWGLLPKILTGEKTIESRWYMNRYAPWDKIKKGETIYFKDSGEPVTVKAQVADVKQYKNLSPKKAKEILYKYAKPKGLGIEDPGSFYPLIKNKNYSIIIFLKNVREIEPFEIDKTGYGAMAAWICVDNINNLKTQA